MKQDSLAAFLAGIVLTLIAVNVALYLVSSDPSVMVGGSVFVLVSWFYAIWRARKRTTQ